MNHLSTSSANDPLRQARELLIRVILWSLGAAAALGVLSVLTGGYFVAMRAAGTALLTSACSGVLWSIGSIDPRHRAARMVGLAATLATYLCLLLPLWGVGAEEQLAATAFVMGGAGAIAVGALLQTSDARMLWTGRVGLVACAVLWFTAIIGIWTDTIWSLPEEAALTWGLFGLSSLLASLCLIGVTFSPQDWWRWSGVGAAASAFLISLGAIWKIVDLGETVYAAAVTLAIVVSHANLMLFAPLKDRYRWLRTGTIYSAVATGVGVDLLLLAGGSSAGRILGRLTAAASILSGVGTLAVIVLALYFRPRKKETPIAPPAATNGIRVVCPRCERQQTLSLGGDVCSHCGLEIEVHVHANPPVVEETATVPA